MAVDRIGIVSAIVLAAATVGAWFGGRRWNWGRATYVVAGILGAVFVVWCLVLFSE
jgi:hypothetical protein